MVESRQFTDAQVPECPNLRRSNLAVMPSIPDANAVGEAYHNKFVDLSLGDRRIIRHGGGGPAESSVHLGMRLLWGLQLMNTAPETDELDVPFSTHFNIYSYDNNKVEVLQYHPTHGGSRGNRVGTRQIDSFLECTSSIGRLCVAEKLIVALGVAAAAILCLQHTWWRWQRGIESCSDTVV